MSVTLNNLVLYGSANMVSADGVTAGGAVAFNTRVLFADLTATGTVDYVSSSTSDTATTIAITGRDSTGVIQTETKTLTGTTAVTGSQSFQRLLQGAVGGTTAAGDVAAISHTAVVTGTAQTAANTSGNVGPYVTLQSGQGASCAVGQVVRITNNLPSGVQFQLRYITAISGDQCFVNRDWGTVPTSSTTYTVNTGMLFELSPNQVTSIIRPFDNCAADVLGGSTRNFYAKIFAVNNNTSITLTGASIVKQVDPSGLYPAGGALNFALCTALNDTGTVANRQTAPTTGITSFSSGAAPQTISVPSPQNLPSGAAPNVAGAQGIWIQYTLPAGAPAFNANVDMRTNGTTT
jgi:hypothetical protein